MTVTNMLEVGCAYRATPACAHDPTKIVIVSGRCGHRIQLAWVDDFTLTDVDSCEWDREYCQARKDHAMYTISAACKIDSTAVQDVLDLIRSKQHD